MSKELELWSFVATRLELNIPVALLIVGESSGSSPGRVGYKMAVTGDDTLEGSIGGGVMEVKLVDQIRAAFLSNVPLSPYVTEQVHQKNSPNSSGMICSGRQTVIIRPLVGSDLPVVIDLIDAIREKQPRTLSISNTRFEIVDPIGEETRFERSGSDFDYSEPVASKPQLYLIGGGHCALALSELMQRLDFYIRIFDDRPDLNTLKKNSFADQTTILDKYDEIDRFVPAGDNTYVVVMTLGYISDEIVIRRLIDKRFKYFGVLGSKAKIATLLRALRADGISSDSISRLCTPIGLPINSRTPDEIAISIAAEIIQVKNS